MLTPYEPELVPERALPSDDDGTMEVPLDDGTLSSTPRVLGPPPLDHSSASRVFVAVVVGALLAVFATALDRPRSAAHVAEASASSGADGRMADAFERWLEVVREDPASRSARAALASATLVALDLAGREPGVGLWTERSAAAADRYARYWPGDPLAPVLVEDAAALLAARGAFDEADGLVEQHLAPRVP
jgi:hypothetical protein